MGDNGYHGDPSPEATAVHRERTRTGRYVYPEEGSDQARREAQVREEARREEAQGKPRRDKLSRRG